MSQKLTTEIFVNRMKQKYGNDYKVLSKYIDAKTKILIEHKCGHQFKIRPDYMLSGNCKCPKCNNIRFPLSESNPELIQYLNNDDDKYGERPRLKDVLEWKCPLCGHIQKRELRTVLYNGFKCEACSDGFSKPEKFMRSFLIQLGINFETQKIFDWSDGRKYDFYFDGIICETHGLQHYEHSFQYKTARSLDDEIENDKYKKLLAKSNGFSDDTYIIIDCRRSEKEWIKNSIINSNLSKKYDISKIDWDSCEKDSLSSLCIQVCKLWNQGYDTSEIKKILNLSHKTSVVTRYLNIGTELGICNYDSSESRKHASQHTVVCLNNHKIFNSIADAENYYHIKNISYCCTGTIKTAGKDPITGESLIWRYYEDYIQLSSNDINRIIENSKSNKWTKVFCLNNSKVFDSAIEAARYGGLKNSSSIFACFRGEQSYAGKDPNTGEKIQWTQYVG